MTNEIINITTEPVSRKILGIIPTRTSSDNRLVLMVVEDVYYDHPQASGWARIQRTETRLVKPGSWGFERLVEVLEKQHEGILHEFLDQIKIG